MKTTESKEPPRAEKSKPQKVSTEKIKDQKKSHTSESASKPQQVAPVNINGEMPKKKHMNRADLESYLKKMGIAYQVTDHNEVFTVEALMKCVAEKNIAGLHMKNLFLKDKKKKDLYLLSARHDVEVSVFCIYRCLSQVVTLIHFLFQAYKIFNFTLTSSHSSSHSISCQVKIGFLRITKINGLV